MSELSKDHYFKIIEEHLKKNNIVTFKWLSRTHNIHNSISKELMKEFLENEPKKEKYKVTFLIFGKTEDGELIIMFSKDNETSHLKEKISVVGKYIYSIELESFNFDVNEVYNIDKTTFKLEQLDLSYIKYPSQIVRKTKVIQTENVVSEDVKNDDKRVNGFENSEKKTEYEVKRTKRPEKTSNLFTSWGNKQKSKTVEQNIVDKNVNSENVKNDCTLTNNSEHSEKESECELACAKQEYVQDVSTNRNIKQKCKTMEKNVVDGFFRSDKKINSKNTNNNCAFTNSSKRSEKELQCEPKPAKQSENLLDAPKSRDNKRKCKTVKKNVVSDRRFSRTHKKVNSENVKVDNTLTDSSEHSEEESELESEPELATQSEKTLDMSTNRGSKRKRKVLEKNVMDSDGFLHTSKEVVYESCCSDDNDESNFDRDKRLKTNNTELSINSAKENETDARESNKNIKTKNTAAKQSLIVNFFKKS